MRATANFVIHVCESKDEEVVNSVLRNLVLLMGKIVSGRRNLRSSGEETLF